MSKCPQCETYNYLPVGTHAGRTAYVCKCGNGLLHHRPGGGCYMIEKILAGHIVVERYRAAGHGSVFSRTNPCNAAIFRGNPPDRRPVLLDVAWLISYPGPHLLQFIREFRGPYCEHCRTAIATDLDHILEVNEGGGLCWVDNFQILCRPCHKAKTAKYAAKRAARARAAKDVQLNLF